MSRLAAAGALALGLLTASGGGGEMTLSLSSPAFENDGAIPSRYTCEGENVSPALTWSGAPEGTKSFALVVDDPDVPDPRAPTNTWVHWVLYDLPPTAGGLAEDAVHAGLPAGTHQGANDWKRPGWGGPCPPIGRHRYFFKLYALDVELGDLSLPSGRVLERAVDRHVLARAVLVGTYEKRGS